MMPSLLIQMKSDKARSGKFGDSKQTISNAEWLYLERSPSGRAVFLPCGVLLAYVQ